MKIFVYIALLLIVNVQAFAENSQFEKNLQNLDYSKVITDQGIIFAPYLWNDNEGVVWYQNYNYEYIFGAINRFNMGSVTIYLQAQAHANDSQDYNDFIANNNLVDDGLRLYNSDEFNCATSEEFSGFIRQVSGKDPVIKSTGDSRILCQVSFSFYQGWESRIEEYINDKTVFDIDVKIPLCSADSDRIDVNTILNPLISAGTLSLSSTTFTGDIFSVFYDLVMQSQQSPELFGSNPPRDIIQEIFSRFVIDDTGKNLTIELNQVETDIFICTPTPVNVDIIGVNNA